MQLNTALTKTSLQNRAAQELVLSVVKRWLTSGSGDRWTMNKSSPHVLFRKITEIYD